MTTYNVNNPFRLKIPISSYRYKDINCFRRDIIYSSYQLLNKIIECIDVVLSRRQSNILNQIKYDIELISDILSFEVSNQLYDKLYIKLKSIYNTLHDIITREKTLNDLQHVRESILTIKREFEPELNKIPRVSLDQSIQ